MQNARQNVSGDRGVYTRGASERARKIWSGGQWRINIACAGSSRAVINRWTTVVRLLCRFEGIACSNLQIFFFFFFVRFVRFVLHSSENLIPPFEISFNRRKLIETLHSSISWIKFLQFLDTSISCNSYWNVLGTNVWSKFRVDYRDGNFC